MISQGKPSAKTNLKKTYPKKDGATRLTPIFNIQFRLVRTRSFRLIIHAKQAKAIRKMVSGPGQAGQASYHIVNIQSIITLSLDGRQ